MATSEILPDLPTDTADEDTIIPIDINQDGVLGKAELQNIDVGLFNDDGTYSAGDQVSFSTGMTEWADGLSNEEINRFVLQTGEQFVAERLEVRQKGGGTSSSFSARIQDTDASSTLVSQDLGGITKDGGTSNTANTLQVQVSNSTGGAINASITVVGRITGV